MTSKICALPHFDAKNIPSVKTVLRTAYLNGCGKYFEGSLAG